MMNEKQVVIFTDLDGTLLDHVTYSWEAAAPALNLINEKAIPLILCSSKTRAEMEKIRRGLENRDPFISENGGAIFIPDRYFGFSFPFQKRIADYKVIELGAPYDRLRKALQAIARETELPLKGYGDLSAAEVAAETGLSIEEARLAKRRDHDEPFVFAGTDEQRLRVLKSIEQMGFRWIKGSRYYHLTGENDKGKAVRILSNLFELKFEKMTTVALGDSPNDLPMLEAVDYPILVQRPDGRYDHAVDLANLRRAAGIGPAGWNSAILNLFKI
jgi:mannosyl-3-phosphoglycerate phosphatase